MKAIILAAGRGSRLNRHSEVCPKGMLSLGGKPILEIQLEILRRAGVEDISILRGYRSDMIAFEGVKYYENPDWANTNMVVSLFCAEKEFDGKDDIVVTYADIIYEPKIIENLSKSENNLSKVIDVDYRDYWTARNGDYRLDSESCTLAEDGSIVEIGEDGVVEESRLHGRDTGITFVSKEYAPLVLDFYHKTKKEYWESSWIDGKSLKKCNMTNLLQGWINNGWVVMAEKIRRGWMEFDTNEDYENALRWIETGEIEKYINLDFARTIL